MTAKEYLSQAYRVDQRINSKLDQILSLRELATKATSVMREDVCKSGRNPWRMEDIIVKIVDLEAELDQDIDELVDLKREIMSVVRQIRNPEHQLVLELRYLCFKTWEQIAVDLDRELRYVYKLHTRSLDECKSFF